MPPGSASAQPLNSQPASISSMDIVRSLRSVGVNDISSVGLKAARLGAVSASAPVVPGVVITADGLQMFLDHNNLRSKMRPHLDRFRHEKDTASLQELQKLIISGSFPEDLKEAITEAYYSLNIDHEAMLSNLMEAESDPVVVVRSSHPTDAVPSGPAFVSVKGIDNVLKAVLGCFASSCSAGLLTGDSPSMAVLIQKMLSPAYSGIARMRADEMHITACYGVQFEESRYDEYIVRTDMTISSAVMEKQDYALLYEVDRLIRTELPPAKSSVQKLTEQHILNVAKACRLAMKAFEAPTAIEYILEKDAPYIVQVLDATAEAKPAVMDEKAQVSHGAEDIGPEAVQHGEEETIDIEEPEPEAQAPKGHNEIHPLKKAEWLETLKYENSKILMSYDLVIYNALRTKYQQLFGKEPEVGLDELIEALKTEVKVPFEEEIKRIRALRNRFLEKNKTVTVDELRDAYIATEQFLKEF
jgi:phosphoenolpyruvate synthase/pyruvate phosphate dikinase